MAKSGARRPLPALAFLLALSLLTALVWWRVLHRADAVSKDSASPRSSCSATPTPTVTAVPAPSAVTVEVLNSTQRNQLAADVGALLVHDGFKIAGVANDQTSRAPVQGVAEIRFGPAGRSAATLLSYYVPGATLVPDTRTSATVDLALGAKYTTVSTAAAVSKALTAARVSQLPPPPTKAKTTAKATAKVTPTTPASHPSISPSGSSSSTPTAPASC
jgi:hypothetical protein